MCIKLIGQVAFAAGGIPSSLMRLINLEELDLNWNELSGKVDISAQLLAVLMTS